MKTIVASYGYLLYIIYPLCSVVPGKMLIGKGDLSCFPLEGITAFGL